MADFPPIPSRAQEEIDLVELFQALWRQKLLIVLIAAVATLLAAAYAFLATPYFKTQSYLRQTDRSSLDQLNETGLFEITPEDALKRVSAGLSSYGNRLEFFRANQALFEGMNTSGGTIEQSFADFNEEAFAMLYPDAKRTDNPTAFVGISLTYPEHMQGVDIVNGFVAYVLEQERAEIREDLQSLIANRLAALDRKMEAARASYEASKQAQIAKLLEEDALKKAELKDEIVALREQLKTQREHRIQRLNEAIAIAESLGIDKPSNPSAMSAVSRSGGPVIRTEITNQEIPLYFMGTEALAAEREALLARTSDDFMEPRIGEIEKELALLEKNREVEILRQREQEDLYLKDLAIWREEAARLSGIKLETDRLRLVRLDQPALQPLAPVKPKKLMIIALGAVLGVMLGVFVALVRCLMTRRPSY